MSWIGVTFIERPLGFSIFVGAGKSGNLVPKVQVGRKAITNIRHRLGEILRYYPEQESISVRLERASAVIWGAAFSYSRRAAGDDIFPPIAPETQKAS